MCIMVNVFSARSFEDNFPPSNAVKFISWMDALLKSIPSEFRDDVEMDIDSYNDHGLEIVSIEIYYYREKTKSEKDEETVKAKKMVEKELARKKKLYEKLKQEFG